MRITHHPILGTMEPKQELSIFVNGIKVNTYSGETIAAAMHASGIRITGTHPKHRKGIFCGIGQCTDCAMVVNDIPNVRVCVTNVEEGMIVESQHFLQKDLHQHDS